MNTFSGRARRLLALFLGVVTLAGVVLLLAEDSAPRVFPAGSHDALAAFALATIAVAYLVFQWARRSRGVELGKAILLAAAFLFWAANQWWAGLPLAGLFNDIAIGLFVLDVFLVIAGWPASTSDSLFTGSCACSCGCGAECGCTCNGWRRKIDIPEETGARRGVAELSESRVP